MQCQRCEEEVEELVKVKDGKKTLKLCESCAGEVDAEAEGAESAMRNMMEYKGKR